jgi:hypothetical protein
MRDVCTRRASAVHVNRQLPGGLAECHAKRRRRHQHLPAGKAVRAIQLLRELRRCLLFWPLQFVAGSILLGHQAHDMFLHGLAFFISACLFTGGLEAMRRANHTPQADSWEYLGGTRTSAVRG